MAKLMVYQATYPGQEHAPVAFDMDFIPHDFPDAGLEFHDVFRRQGRELASLLWKHCPEITVTALQYELARLEYERR